MAATAFVVGICRCCLSRWAPVRRQWAVAVHLPAAGLVCHLDAGGPFDRLIHKLAAAKEHREFARALARPLAANRTEWNRTEPSPNGVEWACRRLAGNWQWRYSVAPASQPGRSGTELVGARRQLTWADGRWPVSDRKLVASGPNKRGGGKPTRPLGTRPSARPPAMLLVLWRTADGGGHFQFILSVGPCCRHRPSLAALLSLPSQLS